MKKQLLSIAAIYCLVLAASCCQKSDCPAFQEDERAKWMPQQEGNVLVFRNTSGTAVTFNVLTSAADGAYSGPCGNWLKGPDDCASKGTLTAGTSDTLIPGGLFAITVNSIFIQEEENQRMLNYTLGDFQGGFSTFPETTVSHVEKNEKMEADSIISNLLLGVRTYEHVIVQSRNRTNPANSKYRIQKVYLAPGYGIVGFTRDTVLYYRE